MLSKCLSPLESADVSSRNSPLAYASYIPVRLAPERTDSYLYQQPLRLVDRGARGPTAAQSWVSAHRNIPIQHPQNNSLTGLLRQLKTGVERPCKSQASGCGRRTPARDEKVAPVQDAGWLSAPAAGPSSSPSGTFQDYLLAKHTMRSFKVVVVGDGYVVDALSYASGSALGH